MSDCCVVCLKPFTRKNKRQVTCLEPACVKAWKDGTSLKEKKPQHKCLNCGKLSPRQLCTKCRKRGESIQVWDAWKGVTNVGERD